MRKRFWTVGADGVEKEIEVASFNIIKGTMRCPECGEKLQVTTHDNLLCPGCSLHVCWQWRTSGENDHCVQNLNIVEPTKPPVEDLPTKVDNEAKEMFQRTTMDDWDEADPRVKDIWRMSVLASRDKQRKKNIFQIADGLIHGERTVTYGKPTETFPQVAKVASIFTGKEITAQDVCLIQVAMKLVRHRFSPDQIDHLVDACGYLGILADVKEADSGTD